MRITEADHWPPMEFRLQTAVPVGTVLKFNVRLLNFVKIQRKSPTGIGHVAYCSHDAIADCSAVLPMQNARVNGENRHDKQHSQPTGSTKDTLHRLLTCNVAMTQCADCPAVHVGSLCYTCSASLRVGHQRNSVTNSEYCQCASSKTLASFVSH